VSEDGGHEEDRAGRKGAEEGGGTGRGSRRLEESGGTVRGSRRLEESGGTGRGSRRLEESGGTSTEVNRSTRRMRSESQSEMDTPIERPK
jgi:hypothetical protein